MKRNTISLLLFLLILSGISCRHNRLKTNEKELAGDILIKEKEKVEAERVALEKELADTLDRPRKGVRYKENRSVNPAHPPVLLNIAGSLNNVKELKLSDIASEISYVRMEQVPDSSFSRAMKFKYYLFPNHIIATNPSGILLYSRDGKFINTIVRNITTGITVDSSWMKVMGVNTFIGGGTSVWSSGDSLVYGYRNNITGQDYIMKYDLSNQQVGLSKEYDQENPDQIMGFGAIAINMNLKNKKPVWKYKISPELVSWGMSLSYIYQSIGTFYLDNNTYAKALERTGKIAVISNQGDTLTMFNGFEEGNSLRFESEGNQYLWNNLNDTVFQITGHNRILPVSVLNLGQYKVPRQQRPEMGSDLTGKIIPTSWAQNKNYIFLTFVKDTWDSPYNRKYKKVKVYCALYSKLNRQLSIIKGDPLNYSPEILENNIDGGLPVWPLSYMIGNNGELLLSLKGKDLKNRVLSKEFRLSAAPESKKKELEKLAGLVTASEDILMIIK